MDKKFYDFLSKNRILLRDLKDLDITPFTKKRSIKALLGVDLKSFYTIIFIRNAKSKFLSKELFLINDIYKNICSATGINIKKVKLFNNGTICSKTRNNLKIIGWKYYDFM